MKTLVFLTADFANLTGDNKLNIMGVFNQIFAQKFPARHPQFHLVIKLGLELGEEPKDRKLTIYLVGEDGNKEKLKLLEEIFDFPERKGGLIPEHTVILNVRDMVFPQKGTYQFLLHIDDRYLDSSAMHLEEIQLIQQAGG